MFQIQRKVAVYKDGRIEYVQLNPPNTIHGSSNLNCFVRKVSTDDRQNCVTPLQLQYAILKSD